MTKLLLQTLGYPEIRGDDGPIKLNLRKGLALAGRDAIANWA